MQRTTLDAGLDGLRNLSAELRAAFMERDELIESSIASLVAGEHVFMIGPPGTAKSAIARATCGALNAPNADAYFEILLTKFTTPDELYGPFSMKKLADEDKLERKVEGYAPRAHVLFLDEIFKASSAILQTLLTALNERKMRQGSTLIDLPLRIVFAASNELPEDGANLEALHDRFLVRHFVAPMEMDESKREVLFGGKEPTVPTGLVTVGQLDAMAAAASEIKVDPAMKDAILAMMVDVRAADVYVSDRRWKKAVKYLKAVALLRGHDVVDSRLVHELKPCLWEKPEQIASLSDIIDSFAATWVKKLRDCNAALDEIAAKMKEEGRKEEPDGKQLGIWNRELKSILTDIESVTDHAASVQVATAHERTKSLQADNLKLFQR